MALPLRAPLPPPLEKEPDVGPPPLSFEQAETVSHLILSHSPDCIKLLDSTARVSWISARSCRLLELDDPARLIGSPWVELWPESARPEVEAAIDAARTTGVGRFMQPCRTFAGTPKWWHVIVTPVRSADHQPLLLALSRDVTELVGLIDQERALTAQAEAAREAANRAAEQKDELLATVSHELRVPLNTVLSWAVLLQTQSKDPAAVEIGTRIERATTEQVRLIDQLLETHRLDYGTTAATVAAVDVQQVVEEAVAVIRPETVRRGLQLTFADDGGDHTVPGDPLRLRQVVINLLSNAAKFTPKGGRIAVNIHSDSAGCRITVGDTGIGIGTSFLGKIFDRYSQENRAGVRNEKGLGLGLHIARRLVEMHGGTITAESAGPQRGAAFTIVLPTMATRAGFPAHIIGRDSRPRT